MARLGRWCFEHRKRVVAVWLLAIVVIAGVSVAAGSSFNSNLSLPGTDSQAAATLLTQNFPAASGEGDQVVIQAAHGTTIKSTPVQSAVTAALAKVAKVPGIETVASPYAKNGAAQISRSGTIAFARVTWDKPAAQVTPADAQEPDQARRNPRTGRTSASRSAASPSKPPSAPASGYRSWSRSPRRWSSC